jgi:hypothetical protein
VANCAARAPETRQPPNPGGSGGWFAHSWLRGLDMQNATQLPRTSSSPWVDPVLRQNLSKYATELGQTPWHRCTDRRLYAPIGRYLGRSLGAACLQLWHPTEAGRVGLLHNVCEAAFRTAKQIGLLWGTRQRVRRHPLRPD